MKKIENLNDTELAVLNEYMEMYGLESLEEALDIAIAEGAIEDGTGGARVFIPEGVKMLKLFTGHQKAKETKVNKALRKAKREPMFEEDCFYLGTDLPKDDNGDFILDECTTTPVGEEPEIIVLNVYYKAVRAAFDGTGKPESTNFDSTLAKSMWPEGQKQMLTPYGSAYKVISDLKKKYHDGKAGKTQEKVPANLKVKFKVVLFGLVKTTNGWEKFMLELSNRFSDKENLLTEWNKRPLKDDNGRTILPMKLKSNLKVVGVDNFENPIIQVVDPRLSSPEEIKEYGKSCMELTRAVSAFVEAQRQAIPTEGIDKSVNTGSSDVEDIDDEDEVPDF